MEWLIRLLGELNAQWVTGAALLALLFERTGIIQSIYRHRTDRRRDEREQLSEDQQHFVDDLRNQVESERRMRVEDGRYYLAERDRIRGELAQRDDTIARLARAIEGSERGNARLRHGLNNAFTYIAALREDYRRHGLPVRPYDGWRDMLGISADLDDMLRELFDDSLGPPS